MFNYHSFYRYQLNIVNCFCIVLSHPQLPFEVTQKTGIGKGVVL